MIGRASMCIEVDKITGKCTCENDVPEDMRNLGRNEIRNFILEQPRHVDESIEIGRKRKICSWAAARSAVKDADVIVCDYNHVFVESIRKASLPSMGLELEDTILVVDEAHNLPNRIRMGLERRITNQVLRDAFNEMEEHRGRLDEEMANLMNSNHDGEIFVDDLDNARNAEAALSRIRENIGEYIRNLKRLLGAQEEMMSNPDELLELIENSLVETIDEPMSLNNFIQTLNEVKVEIDESLDDEQELACHRLAEILDILDQRRGDKALATVFDLLGLKEEGRITTHLLDPGVVSRPIFKQCCGGILMSGTLFPPAMYGDILSVPDNKKTIFEEYSSPFENDRRPVLLAKDVTTKYSNRSEENTRRIREHIHGVLRQTPGHVAIFLPSYDLLDEIINEGSWPGRRIIVEERNWSKFQVHDSLTQLKKSRDAGQRCLLAGVYNARLSEGIDYEGNILDAVICIGIPMSRPTASNQALKEYVAERFGERNAWKYSAAQPAINSILQAMGRPIRKAEDRAIVLILDRRVGDRGYRSCLPQNLKMFETEDAGSTERLIKRFFSRHPEPARKIE
jgi:DNA excision repair protein ERCC-2